MWNRRHKVTHVGVNVLTVGVYDTNAHFNNGEKVALDIMELLEIDPGYYMTKSCRSVNMHRNCSYIYWMSEQQKNRRKWLRYSKKKPSKTKTLKLNELNMERGASTTQY